MNSDFPSNTAPSCSELISDLVFAFEDLSYARAEEDIIQSRDTTKNSSQETPMIEDSSHNSLAHSVASRTRRVTYKPDKRQCANYPKCKFLPPKTKLSPFSTPYWEVIEELIRSSTDKALTSKSIVKRLESLVHQCPECTKRMRESVKHALTAKKSIFYQNKRPNGRKQHGGHWFCVRAGTTTSGPWQKPRLPRGLSAATQPPHRQSNALERGLEASTSSPSTAPPPAPQHDTHSPHSYHPGAPASQSPFELHSYTIPVGWQTQRAAHARYDGPSDTPSVASPRSNSSLDDIRDGMSCASLSPYLSPQCSGDGGDFFDGHLPLFTSQYAAHAPFAYADGTFNGTFVSTIEKAHGHQGGWSEMSSVSLQDYVTPGVIGAGMYGSASSPQTDGERGMYFRSNGYNSDGSY